MVKSSNTTHWPSLLLLLFNLTAIFMLIAGAGFPILSSLMQVENGDPATRLNIFLSSTGMLVGAGLLIFPSFYSLARLAGWPQAQAPFTIRGGILFNLILMLAWMGSLAAGIFIPRDGLLAWMGIPIVNALVAGIPIWILARIGLAGLRPASRIRSWGMFGMGMALGPFFIAIAEIIIFVIIFSIGLIYLGQNPDNLDSLLNFFEQNANVTDPNQMLELLQPVLVHPTTIFISLTTVSVLVPLVEEALKPIGVWLMAEKLISPSDGFAMGILSGAGYALFENLGVSGATVDEWALILTTRIGTSLVHVLSTGLVGWALVSAWREQKFLRLGGIFALAVFLHGAWNTLSVLASGNAILASISDDPNRLMSASTLSYLGLGILTAIMLALLLISNRALRPEAGREIPEIAV